MNQLYVRHAVNTDRIMTNERTTDDDDDDDGVK